MNKQINKQTNEWMGEWVSESMNVKWWMNEWMNEWVSECMNELVNNVYLIIIIIINQLYINILNKTITFPKLPLPMTFRNRKSLGLALREKQTVLCLWPFLISLNECYQSTTIGLTNSHLKKC